MEPGWAQDRQKKSFVLFIYIYLKGFRDAFDIESAIRGGSFWTRIRWGKAAAGPGVRSQDGRKIGKTCILFYLFIYIYL